MNEILEIENWLKDKVKSAGADGVIFGLSGGIDSAVLAAIGKRAFGNKALGLIMPCHSQEQDEQDGRLIAEKIGLNVEKVDLTNVYDDLLSSIGIELRNNLALSNIKPRLRMTTLYALAQEKNYLVIGATNKTELKIGYFTKHGDSGVDLLPLANLLKEEIYALAEALNIPEKIIKKKPSAGLYDGQSDEEEIGITYEVLDNYLKGIEVSDSEESIIKEKIDKTEHKRSYPNIYINK